MTVGPHLCAALLCQAHASYGPHCRDHAPIAAIREAVRESKQAGDDRSAVASESVKA